MSTTTRPYPLNQGVWGTLYANAGTKPLTVALLSGYTYSDAHQYADDLTGELSGGSYARVTITNPTYTTTSGVTTLAGDDPAFASFTGTYDTVVIFADEGADSVSRLISCITTAPVTVTADTLTIDLPAGAIGTYDNATPDLTSVAGVGPDSSGDVPAGSLATALGFVSPGATALGDLSDVNTTGAAEADVLTLESGVWVPATPSAGGGSSYSFVYNPDGTQTGNQYNTWTDLMTATDAVAGPKFVTLNSSTTDSFGRKEVTIPAGGPYDFTDITWTSDVAVVGVTLLIANGATFTFDGHLHLTGGVVLKGDPAMASPAYELPASAKRTIYLDNASVCNEGSDVIFDLPNSGGTLAFVIDNEGGLYNGENVNLDVEGDYEVAGSSDASNILFITTGPKSVVTDDVFRGTVAFTAYRVGSTSVRYPTISHANLTAGVDGSFIISAADKVAVDAAGFAGNLSGTDTTVQTALETIDALSIGSGSVATDAIFDAKGDLAVGTGADTASKLTVGANDTILMAASGEATGAKWATPAQVATAIGASTLAWSPVPTYVTTDQTWTSDTTLANVTSLTQSIGASETWMVDVWLSVSGGGTGDIKVTVTAPTSATSELIVTGVATAGSNAPTFAGIINTPGTDVIATGLQASGGARNGLWIRGLVFNSTNAGSIAVQAAQNTSDGTATRVRKGSFMIARRLA